MRGDRRSVPGADDRGRVASVDVLRGLVMFLMLFVNDVASVGAAPAWMKHFHPDDADGMTFVDVVFPAFLFIVGMAVPLSFRARVQGEGVLRITAGALVRTAALLLLGVVMVNMGRAAVGWRDGLWAVLVYAAAIATWTRWPGRFGVAGRCIGAAGLVVLLSLFRADDNGWLRTSWWGILGLIGWAYLVAFLAHLVFRQRVAPLVGVMALLYAVYIADRSGLFAAWMLDRIIDIGSVLGAHGAIAVAGVILTNAAILVPGLSEARRLLIALGLGAALAVGALLIDPLYGINKNAATPAWCLWSSAITCWAWVAVRWIVDDRGFVRSTALLRDLGRNALLAYLLHPLFYALLELTDGGWYSAIGARGAGLGIARSLALATGISIVVAWMYRRRMRIRL